MLQRDDAHVRLEITSKSGVTQVINVGKCHIVVTHRGEYGIFFKIQITRFFFILRSH